jgi:hypothetical protein
MDMFRETILTLSEFFFLVLGGVPLMNTLWIFPYVVVMSLIMVLPFILYTYGKIKPTFTIPLFLISFFPVLLVGMGPPIVQMQMMQECRVNIAELNVIKDGELEINEEIEIKQCRIKDNYYGEFGEWEIVGLER